MKVLVVYSTRFGNTETIARAIQDEFASGARTARAIELEQLAPTDMAGTDLLVMGSPTHRMNLPEEVRKRLHALPDGILSGVAFAAFDTSYRMNWLLARFTAAKRLQKELRNLGGQRAFPPETFHVAGREGPLCPGEMERAKAWAELMLDKTESGRAGPEEVKLKRMPEHGDPPRIHGEAPIRSGIPRRS